MRETRYPRVKGVFCENRKKGEGALFETASNAIVAKAHAMYGHRLTDANFQDLLNCKTVSDVVSYLKSRTDYAGLLEGVNAQTFRRAQLELILKKHLFDQYAVLSRYESTVGKSVYKYIVMRGEVEQILSCTALLNTENADDYLFTMPAFFDLHTKIDLFRLAQASSFADVVAAVRETPYSQVLERYAKSDAKQLNMVDIDAALYKMLYENVKKLIKKQFSGKKQTEIAKFLAIHLDMLAISEMYRIKRLRTPDSPLLAQNVYFGISNLSVETQNTLLGAATPDELLQRLQETSYAARFAKQPFSYIEDAVFRVEYEYSLHAFRYSSNATVVMLAYLFLAENEMTNITHIVEGIRYQVPPEEIRELLIGVTV